MPARDARLMAAMRLCLERLSERNDLRVSVVDRVRAAVRARLPEGFPTLESIALELRLPLSVIQRELHYDGLSYSSLIEATRRDLALSYVRQRQLPFSEIAFILGYSELSAFSRAVRRWTGQSPRSLRARLLQRTTQLSRSRLRPDWSHQACASASMLSGRIWPPSTMMVCPVM